jgi:hypothetical protein
MAALTANKERRTRNTHLKRLGSGLGVDSAQFYEGQLVAHNNLGRIAPGADTAGFKIAGVGKKRVTTLASNTTQIEFEFGHEEWFPCDANLVAAGVGLDAIMLDDGTLTNVATGVNDVRAGRVTQLETYRGVTGAWIQVGIYGTAGAA